MDESEKWRLVAGFVAVGIVAFLALRAFAGDGGQGSAATPVRISGAGGDSAPGTGSGARGGGGGARIYVHVEGEVRRPGLFRIPKGARVALAVHRAGGPTRRAEMAAVNLAQPLSDGQQVIVPKVGAVPVVAAAPAGGAGAGATGAVGAAGEAPVSLATATPAQLEELDGIGPTLAERIIEFRDENGGIRSVGQLQEVEGIGEKRFAALREAVVP